MQRCPYLYTYLYDILVYRSYIDVYIISSFMFIKESEVRAHGEVLLYKKCTIMMKIRCLLIEVKWARKESIHKKAP